MFKSEIILFNINLLKIFIDFSTLNLRDICKLLIKCVNFAMKFKIKH